MPKARSSFRLFLLTISCSLNSKTFIFILISIFGAKLQKFFECPNNLLDNVGSISETFPH